MEFDVFTEQLIKFYKEQGWYDLDPFVRMNFLNEEVGELSREIRRIEIGRERTDEAVLSKEEMLSEIESEIGDVIDNLVILSSKYNIDLNQVFVSHLNKLHRRYQK